MIQKYTLAPTLALRVQGARTLALSPHQGKQVIDNIPHKLGELLVHLSPITRITWLDALLTRSERCPVNSTNSLAERPQQTFKGLERPSHYSPNKGRLQ